MTKRRFFRTVAVVSAATMLLGVTMLPADAKKKKKKPKGCPAAVFVEPQSPSESRTEAPKGELVKVTNAHTAEEPLVVEVSHGPALWDTANQTPIVEDTKWVNIQVDSKAPAGTMFIRQEWSNPSPSDLDLYLWDGPSGVQTNVSGAFNQTPVNLPIIAETGAMGYESISDQTVGDCTSYIIESRAFMTAGEEVLIKVWLE
jgi:hypothetical protein